MLFNSYIFLFLFLPITFFVYYRIGGMGHHRVAIAMLVGASLFFYGWWNPAYLGLILFSILFNYSCGVALSNKKVKGESASSRKILLFISIAINLILLGYFKYANFFVDTINLVVGSDFFLEEVLLPLAISFFTFQQIAYLVDAYRRETTEYNFLHYCLFVTFFPQLIAGPIVHHREMLPQFAKSDAYKLNYENIAIGLTIFFIGLFKKVVIADEIAQYSTPVFDAAERGEVLTLLEAWIGATSFTFQLYFDFSGYSDMAIGIARLFGIRLPQNFYSPYKAKNIIEFWRCWHMTLSRFLRDYVYIPLGGNRKGATRRYVNLFLAMLVGGLWHGASWTFVCWGGLHGAYLMVNHSWHAVRRNTLLGTLPSTFLSRGVAGGITLFAVVIGWVLFRAESFPAAMNMYHAMFGFNGIVFPEKFLAIFNKVGGFGDVLVDVGYRFEKLQYIRGSREISQNLCLLLVVILLPNTQQIMIHFNPALTSFRDTISAGKYRWMEFNLSPFWAFLISIIAVIAVLHLSRISEFLYFQF